MNFIDKLLDKWYNNHVKEKDVKTTREINTY